MEEKDVYELLLRPESAQEDDADDSASLTSCELSLARLYKESKHKNKKLSKAIKRLRSSFDIICQERDDALAEIAELRMIMANSGLFTRGHMGHIKEIHWKLLNFDINECFYGSYIICVRNIPWRINFGTSRNDKFFGILLVLAQPECTIDDEFKIKCNFLLHHSFRKPYKRECPESLHVQKDMVPFIGFTEFIQTSDIPHFFCIDSRGEYTTHLQFSVEVEIMSVNS